MTGWDYGIIYTAYALCAALGWWVWLDERRINQLERRPSRQRLRTDDPSAVPIQWTRIDFDIEDCPVEVMPLGVDGPALCWHPNAVTKVTVETVGAQIICPDCHAWARSVVGAPTLAPTIMTAKEGPQ